MVPIEAKEKDGGAPATAQSPPLPPPYPEPMAPRRRHPLPPAVNLLFFVATFYTATIAGVLMTLDDLSWRTFLDVALGPRFWGLGLPYSASLILILGSHEMGHYVACRLHRVRASLPFFIPAPPLLGSFGAVIRIREPFRHRRSLFDIGVAGPIAGFAVTIPVLLYGLTHSFPTDAPPRPGDIGLPPSLLLALLYPRYFPGAGEMSVRLDPVFVAGWFGLFATALNLLPIGQLDGGHILYALSPRAHRALSRFGCLALVLLGSLFGGWHLVTFGVLFLIIGPGHPPCLDERDALGPGRLLIVVLALLIFILCFIPLYPRIL